MMSYFEIVWTDYMEYRAELRGFDLARIEQIVRYSAERYVDNFSGRLIAVGDVEGTLVMIPYEVESKTITPVTVHGNSKQSDWENRSRYFRVSLARFKANEAGVDARDKSFNVQPRVSWMPQNCFVCPSCHNSPADQFTAQDGEVYP